MTSILDMRTVLLGYVLSNAICAGIMIVLWRVNRRRSPGIGLWVLDFAMQFVALVLLVLRGAIPAPVSIMLASPLIIGGAILLYVGLERYTGKVTSQRWNVALLGLFIAVHGCFTFVQPSMPARNLNLSVALLLVCGQSAWLMLRRVDPAMRPETRLVGMVFAGYCMFSVARIAADLAIPPQADLFQSGIYDVLVVMIYQMLCIALTFSLSLLVNRRLSAELEQDIEMRKEAEASLRRERDYSRILLDNIPDGIMACDVTGRLVLFNRTAREWHGADALALPATEWPRRLNLSAADVITPMVPESDPLARAVRGEVIANASMSLSAAGQPARRVLVSGGPFCDDVNRALGAMVVLRDVTPLRRAEENLREALNEKTALLNEVHHRVKNNLQVVASLLNLQAGRTQSHEALEVLRDTRNRVRSMSLLHEILYSSGNLARVDFPAYVETLCRELMHSVGAVAARVRVEQNVAAVSLPLEQSVPCGLIINELVSNALKHGFPGQRGGRIRIEMRPASDGEILLRVSDDGAGFSPGYHLASAPTLGLRLVNSLVAQLGGRWEAEKAAGAGAAIQVIFPTRQEKEAAAVSAQDGAVNPESN